jgi:hypothetical protein
LCCVQNAAAWLSYSGFQLTQQEVLLHWIFRDMADVHRLKNSLHVVSVCKIDCRNVPATDVDKMPVSLPISASGIPPARVWQVLLGLTHGALSGV